MELNDLQQTFLSELYSIRFVKFESDLNYADWTKQNGYSQRDVDRCFDILKEKGLAKAYAMGRTATLTSDGALFVEAEGLSDREVINHQERFRSKFLVALANIRDKEGTRASTDWESIIREIGATREDFVSNYVILKDRGFIDNKSVRSFYITPYGYEAVEAYREATKHEQEFERLQNASAISEAERETAFMSLIKAKCITDGWQCEMVALEADSTETLIFYRDLNFFLSECVWRAEELSRTTIRTLRQQVASRPGTYGCVFSMSPVSADAVSEAQMHLEAACIIIFGEEDLADLFHGGTLADAVNVKMVNARIRRSIQAK